MLRPARLPERDCATSDPNAPDPAPPRRRPLSGSKQPPKPTPRKERRAAERQQDRFEVARSDRKVKATAPKKGGSSLVNSRTVTIGAVLIGVLIVALVAYSQLSGRVTDTLVDPAIAYPASIQHDNELGSSAAPVTLEVYDDFQCPYCAKSALDTEPAIVSTYVIPGKVRIVHHDFEWIGAGSGGRESRLASAGAICAIGQGKYWDFEHWTFANQLGENVGSFTRERLIRIATAAGLDPAAFGTCIDSADTLAQVDANTAKFTPIVAANGGTPMFFINGAFAVAGYQTPSAMGALLDAALAGGSAAPASSGPESSAVAPSPSAASQNP